MRAALPLRPRPRLLAAALCAAAIAAATPAWALNPNGPPSPPLVMKLQREARLAEQKAQRAAKRSAARGARAGRSNPPSRGDRQSAAAPSVRDPRSSQAQSRPAPGNGAPRDEFAISAMIRQGAFANGRVAGGSLSQRLAQNAPSNAAAAQGANANAIASLSEEQIRQAIENPKSLPAGPQPAASAAKIEAKLSRASQAQGKSRAASAGSASSGSVGDAASGAPSWIALAAQASSHAPGSDSAPPPMYWPGKAAAAFPRCFYDDEVAGDSAADQKARSRHALARRAWMRGDAGAAIRVASPANPKDCVL